MSAAVSTLQEPAQNQAPAAAKAAQAAPSTALAMQGSDDAFWLALEPRNFQECLVVAKMVFDAKMFRVKSAEDAMLRIMTGRALHLPMFAALKGLYSVEAKDGSGSQIGIEAKLKVAMCLRRSDCEYLEFIERTAEKATWVAKRRGRPEKTLTFTYQEAIEAGLVDRGEDESKKKMNNWNRFKADMLTARCSGRLADLIWPEASLGLESKEDLDDGVIDVPGETVSETVRPMPVQAAPVRDFAAEAGVLKQRIDKVQTPEELKALRADFAVFKKEAPGAISDEVQEHYAKVHGGKAKGQAAQQPAQQQSPTVSDDTLFGPAAPKPAQAR